MDGSRPEGVMASAGSTVSQPILFPSGRLVSPPPPAPISTTGDRQIPSPEMASFADLQARALARNTQTTTNTPEVDMDNAESQLEDQENGTPDYDNPSNDTGAAPHRGLTVDELTQLVQRYNLPERTLADAVTFQRLHPSVQQVLVYLSLQEIRSFISTLPRPEEWWRITLLFEKNVKTYVKALFVQATIKNYSSDTIVSCMEKIIKRLRWGLPANAENNPVLWSEVVSMIQDKASDLRSDWKKAIISSMSKKNHVTGLASTLTSGVEGLKPDGPFLVRVAVLRMVCARDSGLTYWPKVAGELEDIRNSPNPNQILAEYYLEDQNKYPKAGMELVTANFTPTPSDSAIVQTAGQLMNA